MKPNLHLKRERELHGWSQSKMAELLGTDPSTVSRWERGFAVPSPYFREKLISLLGKSPHDLALLIDDESGSHSGPLPSVEPEVSGDKTTVAPPVIEAIYDPTIPLPSAESRELVGREPLIQQVKQHILKDRPGALLVLHGLPGVGKTALAAALAHDPDLQSFFQDGILWAGVGARPDVPSLLSRWGALLRISPQSIPTGRSSEAWAKAIHEAIGRRRMLIIIDDVWEVENALAFKVGGPHCVHLITTRIPRVALYSSADEMLVVPELDEQDSLQLLARIVPTMLVDDPRGAKVLVNAVGGLPLALNLIGKHLRVYAGSSQLRRFHTMMNHVSDTSHRLHLHEPYSPLDRHPSLEAGAPLSLHSIIAISDQYIDEEARRVLRALSLFPAKPNSFSEEAALTICDTRVEVLDTLLDAGLLESQETHRYMLHQTIADYARMHLEQERPFVERLVTYVISLAEALVEARSGDHTRLAKEHRNILATLELTLAHGFDAEYVRIVSTIASHWQTGRMYVPAVKYLQHAYELACKLQAWHHMITLLFYLGLIEQDQGGHDQAETYLRKGLALARQHEDQEQAARFLMHLAGIAEQRGDHLQAQQYLQEHLHLLDGLARGRRCLPSSITEDRRPGKVRVFFTEMQALIRNGSIASLDQFIRGWPYADCISDEVRALLTGPDGQLYGVPVDAYELGLVYNRRLFKEAGLDPDQPPATWEEFRRAARILTNPERHIFGFAESTMYNQGGWFFTNWLYSAGLVSQQKVEGRWRATFNGAEARAFLMMLKEMRFTDGSIPNRILLDIADVADLLAHRQVAMTIAPISSIANWHLSDPEVFQELGLAPTPQNGGRACLMGGNAAVFPRQTPPEVIAVTLDEIFFRRFHPDVYEASLKEQAATGHAIGIPEVSCFKGELHRQLMAITARYTNVPVENYRPYFERSLAYIPEPIIEAQHYYALIDPILQAVLINPDLDPQPLLDTAAHLFEEQFLKTVDIP